MSWHGDFTLRLHYPLKTQDGCFMIIEDQMMHIPLNTYVLTNTIKQHTAVNSSLEDRIHLVFSIGYDINQ